MKRKHYYWLAASCALSLAGCGGGGNGTPDTIPSAPRGAWNVYTNQQLGGAELSVVNALSAQNGVVAVGGIASNVTPLVYLCTAPGSCTRTAAAVSGANSVAAMGFDSAGNLYAKFTVPTGTVAGHEGHLMKLAANASTWSKLGTQTGPGLGLDASIKDKVLQTSRIAEAQAKGPAIDYYGTAALYDSSNNLISSTALKDTGGLSHATGDGTGNLYVGGPGAYTSVTPPKGYFVWTWNAATGAIGKINTGGTTFTNLSGLASDGNGKVFIAGNVKSATASVWKYDGASLSDLAFPGLTIRSIRYLPYKSSGYGYVIVGGTDKSFNGEVWAYNTQTAAWTALGMPNSNGVVGAIAVDASNGKLYVAGQTNLGAHRIWTYSE